MININNTQSNVLHIVIPCYNEQDVLLETSKRVKSKFTSLIKQKKISKLSKVIFVDDGSKDETWKTIKALYEQNDIFWGIKLSKNRGHQNALLAGLTVAKEYADMVISMDADLQDDINAVDEMIEKYNAGCDIVYGVRSNRKKDTFFKRFTAKAFYKLMNFMGAESVFNHADYRLMSKRALNSLCKFKEVNLFLRGIVPAIGYKSSVVTYKRNKRFAGESKYPLKKMISFAVEGITSFSVKPIRMIANLGFLIFLAGLVAFICILIRMFNGCDTACWLSVAVSVWSMGGLILLSIGVVGEYIGKIYLEVKQRPRFIIEKFLNKEE